MKVLIEKGKLRGGFKSIVHSFLEIQSGGDLFYTVQVEVKTHAQEKIWMDLKLPSWFTITKRMGMLGYGRNSLYKTKANSLRIFTHNPTFPNVL